MSRGRRVRAPQSALRLKVTLKGLRPPVWRRLLVEESMTLGDLHMAVQAAMGWENSHLHLFMVGREQYSDPAMLDEVNDEAEVTVGGLAAARVKSFAYIYDMGDDWEHTIAIEGSEAIDAARAYPACTGGRRACPPEDSGGAWGIAHKLAAVADPDDPEREELAEWLGNFDPEAFSVAEAEARVRRWFAPKRGRGRTPKGSGS